MIKNTYSWIRQRIHNFFESELIRRVVKNTGYLFGATGISAAISMVQGILAARLLGVAEFGILGAITVFTSVINKFASFRINELVVKYVGQFTEDGDQDLAAAVFKVAALTEIVASFVAFGLIWILAPIGARYLVKDPGLAQWFVIYGLIVLSNLIQESSLGLLQIFNFFNRIAIINVVQSVVTLLLIILVYLNDGGLFGIILAYMGGKIVGALGLTTTALVIATRRWGGGWWLTPLSLLRSRARELGNFAINTYISGTLSLVTKDSELLWVSFFRSPLETGYYKLALALANLVQMPVSPMPQATYPELSREVAHKNWLNVRYVLRQGSLLAGAYTVMATLVLVIFGPFLIRYVYTPEFAPAYPALLILLAGFLVANTFYWNRVALLAIGRPDFPTKVNLVLAVIKIICILLLVPIYGYLASAALFAGSYIVGVSVSVLKFRSVISKQEYLTGGELPQAEAAPDGDG
jgi:O-antigen/teichoic acid export membrane protein